MREIDKEFDLFRSIVRGLEKTLFPAGNIRNEASDIEMAGNLLNNDDIGKFITAEFIEKMKEKLILKAQGLMKQAEMDQKILTKFAESEVITHEEGTEEPK
jgi:hypothetical protein